MNKKTSKNPKDGIEGWRKINEGRRGEGRGRGGCCSPSPCSPCQPLAALTPQPCALLSAFPRAAGLAVRTPAGVYSTRPEKGTRLSAASGGAKQFRSSGLSLAAGTTDEGFSAASSPANPYIPCFPAFPAPCLLVSAVRWTS